MRAYQINIGSRNRMVLYLLLCLMGNSVHAQVNYVQNGGFETYSRCPYEWDQIKFATGWTAIDTIDHPPTDSFGTPCAPDYLNTCAINNQYTGVPTTGYYYHYPRTGNGMAQTMMYNISTTFPYQRDYLQGKLRAALISGRQYCVTFFVFLEQGSGYAVNHLGAYFDNGQIDTTQNCGLPQTTHIPQVQTLSIVKDTVNWTKIEGSFTATSNESYITIGNFYDNAHVLTSVLNPSGLAQVTAYYLVDDVSVVESNTPAYAGGWMYKTKKDSLFIGRNEIVPDCMWYRNGVLIDTVHAGFWVKDTVNTVYVVKQSICGNVKYDTAWVNIATAGVASVGNESVYRIYPNPASKEIMIQAPNNTSAVGMVVYDMSGRVMMRKEIAFVNGEYRLPIDLNSGMYVVELVGEDGVRSVQRLSVL